MGRSEGRSPSFPTLSAFVAWLDSAPHGTTMSVESLRGTLAPLVGVEAQPPALTPIVDPAASWRERLWLVTPDTRLGVREAAEAVGRPVSWVYRHTSSKTGLSILPHRKLDGELQFIAGELCEWLRANEEVIAAGHMPRTSARHLRAS